MDGLQLLQENSALFLSIIFVVGLLVGSFLNVVAYRLPVMMNRRWRQECQDYLGQKSETDPPEQVEPFNLMWPRSRCGHCGHMISWWENIPVLSYLFLRARCRGCQQKISVLYPLVEVITAVISVVVAWRFGFSLETVAALLLTWALIPACLIDLKYMLLPDSILLPWLWLGLLLNVVGVFTSLESAVVGAAGGYLILWSVYQVFKALTGKEGMGFGDFKLLALIGAWVGVEYLPMVILFSSLSGAIVGLSLVVFRRHSREIPIPFGPYLAMGGWVALIWGPEISQKYLQILHY